VVDVQCSVLREQRVFLILNIDNVTSVVTSALFVQMLLRPYVRSTAHKASSAQLQK